MVKIRYAYIYIKKKKTFLNIRFNYRKSIRLCDYFLKVYSHWAFWTVPAIRLAGPGLVGRGGPERGSVGLGRGTHVVWALTASEHGTSDTCSLIAWTIDLLSNILWEGRVLPRPKQLKIINHKVNKTMHSTVLSESASLLSSLSETSCFPLMKPWLRARCIQMICYLLKE